MYALRSSSLRLRHCFSFAFRPKNGASHHFHPTAGKLFLLHFHSVALPKDETRRLRVCYEICMEAAKVAMTTTTPAIPWEAAAKPFFPQYDAAAAAAKAPVRPRLGRTQP